MKFLNPYEKAIIAADDAQGKIDFACKDGLAEGMAKGMAKGVAEGIAKGVAEGELRAKLETAKNLLKLNKPVLTNQLYPTIQNRQSLPKSNY
jgi:hypothetical protein